MVYIKMQTEIIQNNVSSCCKISVNILFQLLCTPNLAFHEICVDIFEIHATARDEFIFE
jgi:hypothetical protein